jgi:lipoprotein-releasing system permease protein
MIVSVAVVTGFKREVRNKVIGFGSHIQIVNFDSNNSYETQAISKNQPFLSDLESIQGITNVQSFATKPGMIKTEEYIQGIVFKGVSENYNWSFFEKNLLEGKLPTIISEERKNEIIVSQQVARLLNLKTGDKAILYFINDKENLPRILQLQICGIYRTSLEEFDNLFVFGDIKQIQRLNNWNENEISGFEITIDNFNNINYIEQEVRNTVVNYREENSSILRTNNITREYPQIFDWLSILDMNVWVIIILMVLVAGFNMISGLLVLILERSTMIGVLKAMGSPNWSIRKVFLYLSAFLTSRGLIWGNVIAVSIVLIQLAFKIIKLNPESYYVDFVPVNFSFLHILLLNLGSITITTIMMIIPSYLVSKISPDKSIRFD